jgi:ABC-type Fe3+-hydroxamate transport system substrate-binding protein
MMELCGFENCTAGAQTRYPEISLEQIMKLNPELILLSSEPFPFAAKHQAEIQAQFPNAQVILVDGESFSWYGSRLVHAARYFKDLISEIA